MASLMAMAVGAVLTLALQRGLARGKARIENAGLT
jgi:hypothetical protein